MRILTISGCRGAVLAGLFLLLVGVPAHAAEIVAAAVGERVSRAELAAAGRDEASQVARLRGWLLVRLLQDYVASRNLAATADEVAELVAYDREFERRDRAQRARKLAELEQRLADPALSAERRSWLEEFRRVLARMARRDAAQDDRHPDDQDEQTYRARSIEYWKAMRSAYDEYGGVVVLTEAGPAPVGAWAALIADYERSGRLVIHDGRLRELVLESLLDADGLAVPPAQVEFTPYWKLPIPPSYFPD